MTSASSLASSPPRVFAHRGASADAPENTLAAFRLAAEQEADGIELDVWRCETGEVVVHHDPDTRRTAGQALRIQRSSLAALRALDVGAWKDVRYQGEHIPTLREVLEAVPSLFVNVELKASRFPDVGLPGAVARVIQDARAEERCLLSSFDLVLLKTLRVVAPELPYAVILGKDASVQLFDTFGRFALHPAAVHPNQALVTEERIRAWRGRSLDVNVWTVDAPDTIRRMAALGVSGVITNRPALARHALGGDR